MSNDNTAAQLLVASMRYSGHEFDCPAARDCGAHGVNFKNSFVIHETPMTKTLSAQGAVCAIDTSF